MTKEEFLKIIDDVNNSKTYSLYDIEDGDEIESFYEAKPIKMVENLDIDEHRWYEISITVYKIQDWFIGLQGATKLYSEQMDWEDTGVKVRAFEMEEIQSVTYRKKS